VGGAAKVKKRDWYEKPPQQGTWLLTESALYLLGELEGKKKVEEGRRSVTSLAKRGACRVKESLPFDGVLFY